MGLCSVSELLEGSSNSLGPGKKKCWLHYLRRKCAIWNYSVLNEMSTGDIKPFPSGEGCPLRKFSTVCDYSSVEFPSELVMLVEKLQPIPN